MAALPLALNAIPITGEVKAVIQQLLPDATLGQVWSDTLGDWMTPAAASFSDYSFPVTATTVDEAAISYFGNAVFNSDYNGDILIGYKDMGTPGNDIVFSEIHHIRNGQKVSFVVADQRTNTRVAKPFIFEMGRRADGTVIAKNDIFLSDVDVVPIAFDVDVISPHGAWIDSISNIAVDPVGQLSVSKVGIRDTLAIFLTDGFQVAGQTYEVTCDVLLSNSATLELNGTVNCKAT